MTLRRSHTTGMQSKVHPTSKAKYRVANWPAYNQALVRRGDVTVWLSSEAIAAWTPRRSGRRGVRLEFPILSLNPGSRQRCVASGLLQRGTQPRVVEGPHAVDLRRRKHGGPCRAEQCPLDLPLPGLGPAPSGGLTTNSRRTGRRARRRRGLLEPLMIRAWSGRSTTSAPCRGQESTILGERHSGFSHGHV